MNVADSRTAELFGWRPSKEYILRHIFILHIAAALVFEALAFNSDRVDAMISNPGLGRLVDALSPIEKAGCWRYCWHGWGWYWRCGWGWARGWGWDRGWPP